MVKKKFGGEKLDVKGVLAPTPEPKQQTAPAWVQGAGIAAAKPPPGSSPATVAVASAAPKGSWARGAGFAAAAAVAPSTAAAMPVRTPAVGSWAKGSPQGLAATSTSVQQQPKFAPASRPKVGGVAAGAARPALGFKRSGPAAPSFDDDAFPEAERPKTSAEKVEEAATTRVAKAFPDVTSCAEALAELCNAAGAHETSESGQLSAGLSWLLGVGLQAAIDSDARVRLVRAGALVVEGLAQQETHAAKIQEIVEGYFEDQQRKGKNTPQMLEANGLVDAMLFGRLATMLEPGSQRQSTLRLRLVRRLQKPTTPALVQRSLADALSKLLTADPNAVDDVCKTFMEGLTSAQEPSRRGAALGIAAAVKGGGGASALKRLGILDAVRELVASPGKNASGKRQGGLFLLQALAETLGRTFEPYALSSMPLLLESCSDTSKEVQVAGKAAATTVVGQVSGAGVRLMVNPVFEGLKDKRWRTQLSALELLKPIVSELIANAPKRLAAVMPKAVPALCEAGAGARTDLRDAAREVLDIIGTAIQQKEIAVLAPELIAALLEPDEGKLAKAIDSLLCAVYTSSASSTSCALICPVVERALTRGNAEARQKSASFVRTLAQWAVDSEELGPYIAVLQPQLETLLGDPTPAVRDAAAQAIGALAAANSACAAADSSDLASTLLARLDSAVNGPELEGAAQGLAAAMATASEERRTNLLKNLLRKSSVEGPGRSGCLAAMAHLPRAIRGCAGAEDLVATCLPVLGAAVSEQDEALQAAGRRGLVAAIEGAATSVAAAAIAQEVLTLLQAPSADVRGAAAELVLPLLARPCFSASAAPNARSELIAAVVLLQADAIALVRRTADRVWRAATEAAGGNPGKHLKELRPLLINRIAADLASGQAPRAVAAGRSAAQLQGRLDASQGMLEEILPKICEALDSDDLAHRRSACQGLREIMLDTKCQGTVLRNDRLVGGLKAALLRGGPETSEADELRTAAAACCMAAPLAWLVDPILDELCDLAGDLEDLVEERLGLQALFAHADSSHNTSAGLLTSLLSRCATPPYSAAKLRCLNCAAAAPSESLGKVAEQAARACVDLAAANAVCDLVDATTIKLIAKLAENRTDNFIAGVVSRLERGRADCKSEAAARVLAATLRALSAAPSEPEIILDFVIPGMLLTSRSARSCALAFTLALQALVSLTGAAALSEIFATRLAAALADCPAGELSLAPQVLDALAPLLQQGATSAGQERKVLAESSVILFKQADHTSLQAHAVKLTGPLVRSLGEKPADPELQAAVVSVLAVLLERAGSSLRPLLPALQTALLRLLEGPEILHSISAQALGALAPLVPKPESLVRTLGKTTCAAKLIALEKIVESLGPTGLSADVSREVKAAIDTTGREQNSDVAAAANNLRAVVGK